MKKINFIVIDNYAIKVNGQHIDLHNNFDLKKIEYSIEENRISLTWTCTKGDWIPNDKIKSVKINFEEILFLKVELGKDNSDQKSLLFIGYLNPEDIDVMDGCLDEDESTLDYHMIMAFDNGLVIKIFSESVFCKINLQ